jgi:hypothetical protein
MADVEAAKQEIFAAVGDLTAARSRLAGALESLPASPQETSEEDLEESPDITTELRSVIDHGLRSCLNPLIRDLLDAARRARDRSPLFGCDLTTENEATRRAIYELVVAESFTRKPLDPPDDVWEPPYTPEQAGLEVVFQWGRWFATWIKLEEPEDRPERERREVLVYEPDSQQPGAVTCYEV